MQESQMPYYHQHPVLDLHSFQELVVEEPGMLLVEAVAAVVVEAVVAVAVVVVRLVVMLVRMQLHKRGKGPALQYGFGGQQVKAAGATV